MPDDPVSGMKRAVDEHFQAAVGTHARIASKAAEYGGRVLDAGERAVGRFKAWWDDDGKKRRTTDIRLPNEGRTKNRGGRRSSR